MLILYELLAQIATLIAVYANWGFAAIEGIGWRWAGVVWLYNIICYIPLDFIKFVIRYTLSGKAWDLVIEQRVCTENFNRIRFFFIFLICWWMLSIYFAIQIAFTRQKDFGKEARELKWAHAQRTLHGLQMPDVKMFNDRTAITDLNQMAEEAKRRAEIAR